ncbi:hypothetical protein Aduo_007980 [Ancylostoma duodenale]
MSGVGEKRKSVDRSAPSHKQQEIRKDQLDTNDTMRTTKNVDNDGYDDARKWLDQAPSTAVTRSEPEDSYIKSECSRKGAITGIQEGNECSVIAVDQEVADSQR